MGYTHTFLLTCLTSFLLQQTVCLLFISLTITTAVVCILILYVGCHFCYILLFFKQMSILILQFNWSQKFLWFQALLWCKWASLLWGVMQHRIGSSSWTAWPLKLEPISYPATFTNYYQYVLCNNPEEWRPHYTTAEAWYLTFSFIYRHCYNEHTMQCKYKCFNVITKSKYVT